MPIEAYLQHALHHLESIYAEMHKATGRVLFRDVGPYRQFRHETLTESLICYLKGVKTISTLNACLLLLRHGYTQEIGALCRMVDDFCNEIFFLLQPQGENGFSDDQKRFIESFFQEEFDKPGDPLGSTQKRDTVSVRKIHATFAKLASGELNPSDAQQLLRTTHQAFSGYVHGAYPHIMEMFGGNPPAFHMSGMLGTPRVDEWRGQLVGYVHRLIIASVFVARKLGITDMERPLRAFLSEFEATTGTAPALPAGAMLAEYKKSRAT
ncbi:MAG TPA: hypothetical protein VEN78_01870 [Bradyrhizobium sp.]|nr:hypothetical protein [Bradyrhizobium sp.]